MLIELQKHIIYGPINSRRLGLSLGINLLPFDKKICPFDCVYCQYGWTEAHQAHGTENQLPPVQAVLQALGGALRSMENLPAYITFSGNGEPTLHPHFGKIVDGVNAMRSRLAPNAKTAILSNSASVFKKSVRKALAKLDVRTMKLDCGSPPVFRTYNRPCPGITLDKITDGLTQLSNITIQSLWADGDAGNLHPDNLREWIERLKRIKPLLVQIYTMDRGYPSQGLIPVSRAQLHQIEESVKQAEIPAITF